MSKAWTSEQVLKQISEPPNYASTANDGPTPMEVDRVEKGKESRKARARAKVDQGQNGLDLGCFIEAVDEDAPTKEKERANQKGSQKERRVPKEVEVPKERKVEAETRLPMGNVQIASNMDIGAVIAHIWSTKWLENRNQYHQPKPLHLLPQQCLLQSHLRVQQCGVFFSLVLTFQSFFSNFTTEPNITTGAHGFVS